MKVRRRCQTMFWDESNDAMKKHAAQFRKSHKRARFVVKRKRLCAEVKRPAAKAEDAIRSFFRAFAATRSHLAYPEEMLVLERPAQ